MRRSLTALTALLVSIAIPAGALAAEQPAPPPAEPASSQATWIWALLQLIPSSEVVIWDGTVRYGARWQVTPLLYSFGGNRKLSRWRSFVVEPVVRHAGSIEFYVAPEVLTGSFADNADRWIFRGGLRSYVPLLHRGEYLSASFGGSVLTAAGKAGVGVDAGLHTFGGMFGVRAGYSPTPGLRMTTLALELRIF
ncbi:MAG: hypothetical protein QM820_36840 [Minicystis sp.]